MKCKLCNQFVCRCDIRYYVSIDKGSPEMMTACVTCYNRIYAEYRADHPLEPLPQVKPVKQGLFSRLKGQIRSLVT